MSNTFSPRTDGTVGKVAVRSQAHAAHLTIPLMLDAGSDIQDNNPTGPEHTEGGDSLAQAPARHTMQVAGATAVDASADQGRNSPTVSVAGNQIDGNQGGDSTGLDLRDGYIQVGLTTPLDYLLNIITALESDSVDPELLRVLQAASSIADIVPADIYTDFDNDHPIADRLQDALDAYMRRRGQNKTELLDYEGLDTTRARLHSEKGGVVATEESRESGIDSKFGATESDRPRVLPAYLNDNPPRAHHQREAQDLSDVGMLERATPAPLGNHIDSNKGIDSNNRIDSNYGIDSKSRAGLENRIDPREMNRSTLRMCAIEQKIL